MELVDLIQSLKTLRTRSRSYHVDDAGEYAELVFYSDDLAEWEASLSDLLGSPIKKPADPVSQELTAITEPYGELYDHQTLYIKEEPGLRILAMVWPWRDNVHSTLKLIFQRASGT